MSDPAAGVVAAILAGGRGTRMGGEGDRGITKGLLVVEGQRIIDRQLAVLRPCFAEVLLSANDPTPWADLGLQVIPDLPNSLAPHPPVPSPREAGRGSGRGAPRGPIAGLAAILAALPTGADAVVCVAADMPFLSPALLEHLRDTAPGAPAVVPRVADRAEPLLARYARAIAPVVAAQIAAGAHALVDLLARLDVAWIDEPELRALDPGLRSLVNVNTPADLARLDPDARS
ncbi:MAG TPA: molybdenum cofactor guanylyltransferase [Polyangia bacterium]|jgi:molybdopterin-guanine dinucleotide biosynthesis protein A|nr:molybdenum cofactor guanylyltransferase [Polyangia bacterium]